MPAADDSAPLFRFESERNEIVAEVVDRVTRGAVQRAWESPEQGLEYLLNEAAFREMARLEDREGPRAVQEYAFWRDVAHKVGRASEDENAALLHSIVQRYGDDTAGRFRPGVYQLATRVLPGSISFLFSRQRGTDLLMLQPRLDSLRERVVLEGELGKIRQLAQRGTVVVVPTHSSHMDSLLIGWALHASGLPPVTYGAGKNLFTNPMTSFFMANLGAYKVDRRLRHTVYTSVLKEYSQVLLERGYHSLFFPGGTRSRSNHVESRLKLGLLGTALDAFTRNVQLGRPKPNVYIVPVTINYNLILEAETLIDEHLKKGGQGRYIIEDDEFSDIRRVAQFVKASLDMDSSVTLRFCTPRDVFGNEVGQDGESLDAQGRAVDPARYLWIHGEVTPDRERDMEYTRELGVAVAESFRTNTVIYPLHVVAFALFEHLRRQHASWDIYRVLRFARGDSVSVAVAEGETERLVRLVRRDVEQGRYRAHKSVLVGSAHELVREALRYFGTYHTSPIARTEHGSILLMQLKLLYYYSNRLRGFDLERRLRTPGGY